MNFCDLPEVLSPSRNAAPLQRSNSAASSVFRSATEQAGVAFPNTLKAGQVAGFSVIADEIPSTENKGYPPGLFVAAANAVNGLAISAGDSIYRLAPDDYQDIIDDALTACFLAEKWSLG